MSGHAKHWCEVCDQGWVEQVSITPGHHKGWLCGECEAFWPKKPLLLANVIQFSAWLKEQGIGKDDVKVERE